MTPVGSRAWERPALQLALALNAVMLVAYLLLTMRLVFDADFGAKNMVASLMLEQGRFFPRGFGFWNDLWIVHGHLPLVVLIPLFGNSFLSNALSSIIFAGVFLLLVYALLRRLDVRQEAALLTTLIVGCGFSEDWAAFMYGQAAYGYVCLLLLLGLFAVSEGLLATRGRDGRLVFVFAVSALLASYGGRLLMTFVVPAAVSLMLLRFDGDGPRVRPAAVAAAATGVLIGLLFRAAVAESITFHSFASYWIDRRELSSSGLLQAATALFGLLPPQRVLTDSAWGFVFPLRLVFLLTLGALVVAGSRRHAAGPGSRRFLVCFAWLCAALTIYLTSTVLVLTAESRYLMPPLFVAVLVAAFALDRLAAVREGRRLLAAATVPLLVLSFVTYVAPLIPEARGGVPWQGAYDRGRRLDRLIQALEQRGIRHAYASYGHSTAVTVLSDSRVAARQVQFVDGLPRPEPLLSYERWYADETPAVTALIVDLDDPSQPLAMERLTSLLGPPEASEQLENFLVVSYPRNVFPQLPEWQKYNLETGAGRSLVLAPAAVHSIAGVGTMADGLLTSTGKPGALVYGPYIQLAPGRYRFRIELVVHADGGSPGYWDISVDHPRVVFARGDLPPGLPGQDVIVDEIIRIAPEQRDLRVEVRVFASGAGRIAFRRTSIERLD